MSEGDLASPADLGGVDPGDLALSPGPPCTFAFAVAPSSWAVPASPGGLAVASMLGPANRQRIANDVTWSLLDLNGDKKLDLVVGRVAGQTSPGPWQVYLGQSDGFAPVPVSWSVPDLGTAIDQPDSHVSRPSPSNYAWTTVDMNGDGLPDFVYRSASAVLDAAGSPHWDVYLNTGDGFAATAATWAIPRCGAGEVLSACSYSFGTTGSDLADVNGDHKPDLVFMTPGGLGDPVWGYGTAPVWKVFFNSGTGFDAAPTDFSLPVGTGTPGRGPWTNGQAIGTGGDLADAQVWIGKKDLDGDGRADLILTGHGPAPDQPYGTAAAPAWLLHRGESAGFAPSSMSWRVPALDATIFPSGLITWGSTYHDFVDVNGDARPELVFARGAAQGGVLMQGGQPVWRVYHNNGAGLHDVPTYVPVPAIDTGAGVATGLGSINGNAGTFVTGTQKLTLSWFTEDLDGDGVIDLVLTGGFLNDPSIAEVYDAAGTPHWNIHRGSCL